MLNAVKSLYDEGFAIHLLNPKSKRPIEKGWTKGPRKTWGALETLYKPGMNLGVRLGTASKLRAGGYLAVIDCDVKGALLEHQKEMFHALYGFIEREGRICFSGRGNGSKHVYIRTPQPIKPRRLAQSPHIVKVHMPSVQASTHELTALTDKERLAGLRLRPAWEISLMGEGQQVVIPPSIHPDTGGKYMWGTGKEIPDFTPVKNTVDTLKPAATVEDYKVLHVDLVCSRLSTEVVELILHGTGCDDRSAALFKVSIAMLRAGFKDNEILTVLSDREHYLGQTGYDHAQTTSRAKAVEWLRKYTLVKAKEEVDDTEQFAADVVETPLTEAEAKAQDEELAPDWRTLISRSGEGGSGPPKSTVRNVMLILQGEGGGDVFRRDEFANAEVYARIAPWGGTVGAEFTDIDILRIKKWLSERYRFEPSNDRINEAVSIIADRNRYHPVRDYLDTLVWDGTPRIDTWLKTYLGATGREPYLSAASRKVLSALVARIYRPGVKFDHVLILQGDQGVGKSTALRHLVGDEWFTDAHIDVKDKDAVMAMRSKWLIELGELSGMRSADVEQLKEFISRPTDRIRVPYGKRAENFPRQCVFVGSTNQTEYLKDSTGNRRFWPVSVGGCRFDLVKRDRDQLLAEAKAAFDLGEPLYLEDDEMVTASLAEQGERMVDDSFDEIIGAWLAADPVDGTFDQMKRNHFSLLDLFTGMGPLKEWKANQPEMKRASIALRKHGFEKRVVKLASGKTRKEWFR